MYQINLNKIVLLYDFILFKSHFKQKFLLERKIITNILSILLSYYKNNYNYYNFFFSYILQIKRNIFFLLYFLHKYYF